MKEMLTGSVYFGVVLTLICFEIGLLIKKKVKLSIANPLLIATIIIIAVLVWLGIDYETYKANGFKVKHLDDCGCELYDRPVGSSPVPLMCKR